MDKISITIVDDEPEFIDEISFSLAEKYNLHRIDNPQAIENFCNATSDEGIFKEYFEDNPFHVLILDMAFTEEERIEFNKKLNSGDPLEKLDDFSKLGALKVLKSFEKLPDNVKKNFRTVVWSKRGFPIFSYLTLKFGAFCFVNKYDSQKLTLFEEYFKDHHLGDHFSHRDLKYNIENQEVPPARQAFRKEIFTYQINNVIEKCIEDIKLHHLIPFVSKEIADKTIHYNWTNDKYKYLDSKNSETSILLMDIKKSTSLWSKVKGSAEHVNRIINIIFEDCVDVIENHEGAINVYVGDEILAFFNAYKSDKEHLKHSLQCAKDIRNKYFSDTTKKINKYLKEIGKFAPTKYKTPEGFGLRMGITVTSKNETLLGLVGSKHKRHHYTVVSEQMNALARGVSSIDKVSITHKDLPIIYVGAKLDEVKQQIQSFDFDLNEIIHCEFRGLEGRDYQMAEILWSRK